MSVPLTEAGWKAVATKFKIKDNGLDKALTDYQKLPADGPAKVGYDKYLDLSDKRTKSLKEVQRFAGALLKTKEAAANKDVAKYLKDLDAACVSEEQATAKGMAEVQTQVKKNDQEAKAREDFLKHPDPKNLKIVYDIGYNDGATGDKNLSQYFAKWPPYQAKYIEGYRDGQQKVKLAVGAGAGNQGPSMSSVSKEEVERAKQYAADKARRKAFIQYLNEWWNTTLPEDM